MPTAAGVRYLAPSGTFQQTAPRQAQTGPMTHRAEHVRGRRRQGRLRTQPADHRAEQNADCHRVRAEQYIAT